MQIRTLDRTLAVLATLAALKPVEQAKAPVLARTIFFVLAFILSAVLFFWQAKAPAEHGQ